MGSIEILWTPDADPIEVPAGALWKDVVATLAADPDRTARLAITPPG